MPMPQSAVRGSPVTERRQGTPALRSAAETIDCGPIVTEVPFTKILPGSGMYGRLCDHALRQVGSGVDLRSAAENLVYQQSSGCGRVGDAEALEANRKPKGAVVAKTFGRADQW